jgi:transglutaminase-like putative cysteine protease
MSTEQTREPAGEGEAQAKPHQRILKSKSFIPIVVVVGLICAVLLSSRLAGRPPQIDSITPRSGKPGDVLIVTGRYFGDAKRGNPGEVRISGISPTSGEYIERTDTRISVVIPEEAVSGLVYVITKDGKSRGFLFTNRDEIPVLASGPSRPGEPYIDVIAPMAARVGELITIRGKNFGLDKGHSEVYFTWGAGSKGQAESAFDLASLVPAREANFDYESWSDIEVVLRVPDGAASGNVLVTSDKGKSNSVYFEVLGGAGLKNYSDPRKYSVQYSLSVFDVAASGENILYAWMPHISLSPEQRSVELVSQEPEPMLGNHNGAALFALTNLQKGGKYRIALSWMLDRYAVESQVNPSKLPPAPDTASELYRRFTAPDVDVPSGSPDVVKALPAILQGEKNQYLKARRVYDYVVSAIAYSPSARGSDALSTLKAKRGDDFSLAALTCALFRAAGVPARMVAGYISGDSGERTTRHFWDEFYVETVGWLPADPLLGREKSMAPAARNPDVDLKTWYFGNMDNRHITLSRGLDEVNQMRPDGKVRRARDLPYLITINEESVGPITAYTAQFNDLEVTGVY